MSIFKLPDENYKYGLSYNSNFNNQLLSGINSGLLFYNYQKDTQLYRPTDMKPLDKISFDVINDDLDKYNNNYSKSDDLYNNSKASVASAIAGISKSGDDIVQKITDEIKKVFTFDTSGLKTYASLFLLFIIFYKKI